MNKKELTYKKREIVRIDLLEYSDGGIMFDVNTDHNKVTTSSLSFSLVDAMVKIFHDLEIFSPKDVRSYERIHDCHKEVIDELIIEKMKDALKLSDIMMKEYYRKPKK